MSRAFLTAPYFFDAARGSLFRQLARQQEIAGVTVGYSHDGSLAAK
jgi:hypothetical protein